MAHVAAAAASKTIFDAVKTIKGGKDGQKLPLVGVLQPLSSVLIETFPTALSTSPRSAYLEQLFLIFATSHSDQYPKVDMGGISCAWVRGV